MTVAANIGTSFASTARDAPCVNTGPYLHHPSSLKANNTRCEGGGRAGEVPQQRHTEQRLTGAAAVPLQ